MRDLLIKIVAGVIAGLLLFYLTQYYLSKPEQHVTQPTQKLETVTPNVTNQSTNQPQHLNQVETLPLHENTPAPIVKSNSGEDQMQNKSDNEVDLTKKIVPTRVEPKMVYSRKTEEQLQPMIKEAREKGDSLSKDNKIKDEVKKVNKKADDAFDELEKEIEQNPSK